MTQSRFLETIKSIDGQIQNIEYHQKRYESVLASVGINAKHQLKEYINPPKDGLYRCRLIYSTEDIDDITVTYHPYTKRTISSLKIIYDDTIEYSKKYLDREAINALFSQKEECDDILIVKNGFVTDTSIANIALLSNGIWYTPKTPLLNGTTRQRYIDLGKLQDIDIKVEELHKFSQIALLNAMIDFDILSDIKFIN